MAEAAGPGPPSFLDRCPALCRPAVIPGRPCAPCLPRRDWLSLPPPPKMAPFTQLRGFGASRPWRRTGCCGSGDAGLGTVLRSGQEDLGSSAWE